MCNRWYLLLFICAFVSGDDSKVVTIGQGSVRGYKVDGVYSFEGIPYATAPVGRDRFKAPLPPPTWAETLDAVDKRIVCPQVDFVFTNLTGYTRQDDCLIANIYVPDTEETNLPVVVYVHGGAFHVGYGNSMKPTKLVDTQNVIAVNFNYRLGILGFLCLGTEAVPGNAGLKDQLALLRWVKENIAAFGGNPDEVTIAGYSAGSSSVELLMLSKAAEGLFRRVIPESGSHLALFSVQMNPQQTARDYAKYLGFSDADNLKALEEFYTTAPLEEILVKSFMDQKNSDIIFVPCVERDVGVERILDDAPINILKNGNYMRVPVLVGFDNMEGILRFREFHTWKDEMNEKFSDFLPVDLRFDTEDEKEAVAKKIKKIYFGDKDVGFETIMSYIDFFSDISFVWPPLRSLQLQLEGGNDQLYLYEYSYAADEIPSFPFIPVKGAPHCAQTGAVMDYRLPNDIVDGGLTEESKKMRGKMRELWGNFIKYGKPVPDGSELPSWPALNNSKQLTPYMSLGQVIELKEELIYPDRITLWDEIYKKYYRTPIPPVAEISKKTEL